MNPVRVTAIVPAFEEEQRVGATVRALLSADVVDDVVVVDDGSRDRTAERARAAGARVLRLARNRGKAAAVRAGVEGTDAAIVLLCDADLGETAANLAPLARAVAAGEADMAIATVPNTAGPSGFGLVEGFARWGIARASGRRTERPLSGQRAIRRDALAGIRFADGFGLEIGLTIDMLRAGKNVVELPCHFTHARTARDVSGFAHRAKQGIAVARALRSRTS